MNASRPLPTELDPTVVERAVVGGSRSAFIELYRHYEGKVRYGVARAAMKLGRRRDVDELVQEVWCRLMSDERRILRYYDPERGRFGPFIGWVAYQQTLYVLNLQRNRARAGDAVESEALVDEGSTQFVAELFQRDFFQKLLARVDAELAPHDRVILREHYLGGRTIREIAEELGAKEDAIYQRNRRLKKKLATIVEQLQPPPTTTPRESRALMTLVVAALLWPTDLDEPEPGGHDASSARAQSFLRAAR